MTDKTTTSAKKAPVPVAIEQGNGLAITSLVLGILSLTGMLFLTGVPAIVTGIMSLRRGQKERGMSIAGIIMGAIGTLLSLLILLALIVIAIIAFNAEPTMIQNGPSLDDTEWNMPIESSRT